jgi:hypothetical protein
MLADLKPLYDLYRRLALLTDDNLWFNAVDNRVIEFIIDLNTNDQLFEDGIDSLGRQLGDYAPFTVESKKGKGDRYDHITLKDTGKFYDSWTVRVDKRGLELDADDFSHYDEPLFSIYGEDVLGLTDENKDKITAIIRENYINYVRQQLLL